MATNEIEIAAHPEAVWSVLSDSHAYRAWVTGTKRIRGADEGFPAAGTRLYHTVGIGPLTLSDSTLVLESDEPRLLRLEARLGPVGTALVELCLEELPSGSRVRMHETAAKGPSRILQPVGDLLLRGRNAWSLERLKELVERRA
jgi:uncharacterized protein YndB with AHSA1/START domain